MDKQKGLDILGLAPSATCTDARTAFRRLAKTWHPDRFAKDPAKTKIAEEKMKQVNEAFHFLLHLLPKIGVEQGAGQNPLADVRNCTPPHSRGKRPRPFFSSLAAGLKKRFNTARVTTARATGRPTGPQCRARAAGQTRQTAFEAAFQAAVNQNPAGTKTRLHPQKRPSGSYADYKKYFDSAPGRRRNNGRFNNRGAGPVEEISPISPVAPVGRRG